MNKLFDLENPFFAPTWIRVCVVAITALWGMVELANGETFWAAVILGVSGFCTWRFYVIDYTRVAEE